MREGRGSSHDLPVGMEAAGVGEPLIVLPGGPGWGSAYLEEVNRLQWCARVVLVDYRGVGKSPPAPPGTTHTLEEMVEDVERVRLALDADRVALLGHALGGAVALAYALRYPARVSKLVLVSAFPSARAWEDALAGLLAEAPREAREVIEMHELLGVLREARDPPVEYQAAVEAALAPRFIGIPAPAGLRRTLAAVARAPRRALWGEDSAFRITGDLASFDATRRLASVRAPALVIVGASDLATTGAARALAEGIPGARLEIFSRSRHFPFLEEPEKFERVVSDFLLGRAAAARAPAPAPAPAPRDIPSEVAALAAHPTRASQGVTLWSPTTIFWVTLATTPPAGFLLAYLNWHRMGEPGRARRALLGALVLAGALLLAWLAIDLRLARVPPTGEGLRAALAANAARAFTLVVSGLAGGYAAWRMRRAVDAFTARTPHVARAHWGTGLALSSLVGFALLGLLLLVEWSVGLR